MFAVFRKKRRERCLRGAEDYIKRVFSPEKEIYFSRKEGPHPSSFSLPAEKKRKQDAGGEDAYSTAAALKRIRECREKGDMQALSRELSRLQNPSFVESLIHYIDKNGLRDSAVYKAAMIDKRLFSKILSDRDYRPAKDTVIALAFGLALSHGEAKDLLSRAGYAFSHSDKRDIVIEYFFLEGIFDLIDINAVLARLGFKPIGRF